MVTDESLCSSLEEAMSDHFTDASFSNFELLIRSRMTGSRVEPNAPTETVYITRRPKSVPALIVTELPLTSLLNRSTMLPGVEPTTTFQRPLISVAVFDALTPDVAPVVALSAICSHDPIALALVACYARPRTSPLGMSRATAIPVVVAAVWKTPTSSIK